MPKKKIRQQYYLDPFPFHTDDGLGYSKRKYEWKVNCIVLPQPLMKDGLKDVPSYATLIIDGHGTDTDHTRISAEWRFAVGLPVDKLADMIANYWRLPKQHVKIRMLSCWGYGFARLLAILLGNEGYQDIHVAGYKGPTGTLAYENKTGRGPIPIEIDGQFSYDKSRIEWYDADGQVAYKPDVGETAFVGESDSAWN